MLGSVWPCVKSGKKCDQQTNNVYVCVYVIGCVFVCIYKDVFMFMCVYECQCIWMCTAATRLSDHMMGEEMSWL